MSSSQQQQQQHQKPCYKLQNVMTQETLLTGLYGMSVLEMSEK